MTNNQASIDLLKEAIATREPLIEYTDQEQLDVFKKEREILDKIKEAPTPDETLNAYVNALSVALTAVIEIKEAMLAGASLNAAELSAVVTANDLEEEIAEKYL